MSGTAEALLPREAVFDLARFVTWLRTSGRWRDYRQLCIEEMTIYLPGGARAREPRAVHPFELTLIGFDALGNEVMDMWDAVWLPSGAYDHVTGGGLTYQQSPGAASPDFRGHDLMFFGPGRTPFWSSHVLRTNSEDEDDGEGVESACLPILAVLDLAPFVHWLDGVDGYVRSVTVGKLIITHSVGRRFGDIWSYGEPHEFAPEYMASVGPRDYWRGHRFAFGR